MTRKLPQSATRVETGPRVAALDVLKAARASGQDQGPTAGSDGAVTALPDLCDGLARDVRGLLPKAKSAALTGDDQLRGCGWQSGEYGSLVQVIGYAAGASPLRGGSAVSAAEAAYRSSLPAGVPSPVRSNQWDEGRLSVDHGAWHLTVRSGNVVLVVQLYLRYADLERLGAGAVGKGDRVVQPIAAHELAAIKG